MATLKSAGPLKLRLFDGHEMPQIGLGTWMGKGDTAAAIAAVTHALKNGYKMIDTATIYRDEAEVGKGIAASGIKREDLWLQTKLWNNDRTREKVHESCKNSLKALGVSYLDLLLIHWPYSDPHVDVKETWQAMEELVEQGSVKYIGLSNFSEWRVKEVLGYCKIRPAVNQCEIHPWLQQEDLVKFLISEKIVAQAYMPFGNLNKFFDPDHKGPFLIEDPELVQIAKDVGITPNQLCVSFAVARGISTIPKSVRTERIDANLQIADLSDDVMQRIRKLDKNQRFCNLMSDWGEKW